MLYSSASSSSYNLGALEFGEGYYVNAYQQVGNNYSCEIVKVQDMLKWLMLFGMSSFCGMLHPGLYFSGFLRFFA